MARPKKDSAVDLSVTHELSVGLIERLTCPKNVPKAFLRDKDVTGLRVRVTAKGAKSFVYEAKLNGKAISKTLGGFPLMSIVDAKDAARLLAKTVKTDKVDPRELDRQQKEAAATAKELQDADAAALAKAASSAALTVSEVWAAYMTDRKERWGDRHYQDHLQKAAPGGVPVKRGSGLTTPGPLYPLMALALRDLSAATVETWAAKEAKTRPTSARLSWRLLKSFLNWCTEQPAYAGLLSGSPAKTKKAREALGKPGVKQDALLREQLPVWFTAVQQIGNQTIAAYLQVLLLTGARPGEVMTLQWKDVNTQWKGLTIRDKVEGERVIPLTPYVAHLLAALPNRNQWVFSSVRALDMSEKNSRRRQVRYAAQGRQVAAGQSLQNSSSGHITEPNQVHSTACSVVGIDGLSLHGLRRSFKSLTEWLEIPAGVVAQLMGHKPSATAEKHYTVRPLDLLRVHHERIEAWILEQAGIVFDAKAEPGKLRVVAG